MDPARTSRIPNLGHFLFFFVLTLFSLGVSEVLVIALAHGTPVEAALRDQRLQLFANVITYVIALLIAFVAMPVFWHRPFLVGLQWNAAKVQWWFGIAALVAGFAAQGVTVFIPHTKDLPIEEIFHNPALIWFMVLFGVIIGPLFEEVMFRGFLLPAIAIAVDWVRIPRGGDDVSSLENLITWRSSTEYSDVALVISSIITSALFAMIHAPQLGYTMPALALLMCVSIGLCFVRIRTGSVASSAFVHGCYNLSIFLTLFVTTSGFRHLEKM